MKKIVSIKKVQKETNTAFESSRGPVAHLNHGRPTYICLQTHNLITLHITINGHI